MSLRFTVERTWDVKGRTGLLVRGRVSGGPLRPGMKLGEQGATRTVRIDGIELIDRPGTVTVVVDRSARWLREGVVLTEAASMAS